MKQFGRQKPFHKQIEDSNYADLKAEPTHIGLDNRNLNVAKTIYNLNDL